MHFNDEQLFEYAEEAQHGTITVESELNRGSTFTISIPRESESHGSQLPEPAAPDPSREQTLMER